MNNPSLLSTVKIILSMALFAALLDMPYGYYEILRILAMIGFGILALNARDKGFQNEMIVYIGLIILFQPFYKLALGRVLWNVIDVLVGLGLLLTISWKSKK